ncbi:hypothetical protein N7535_009500, partial [Penicillium sp. DV-2018c]
MASRRKQPAARQRENIHFVNARPTTETERLNAQRLVRAHVGRWISEQTKDRSDGGSSTARSRPVHGSSSSRAGPAPTSFALVSRPSNSRRDPILDVSYPFAHDSRPAQKTYRASPPPPSHASDSTGSSSSSSSDNVTVFSSEPRAIVRFNERPCSLERLERNLSDIFDPFATYPAPRNFSPAIVNMSERYLTKVIWPGLAPSPNVSRAPVSKWFHLSMSDPALFTAFMYGALCHLRVQCRNNWVTGTKFGRKEARALELCEMESIKLISQAIQDPSRAISDAVLLSVICMAHHQADKNVSQQHQRTPFDPPFRRLQWIDVYGCLPPNMIHIKGLLQLVELRGGLTNISTEGLSATISFSDIMTCSVLCIHPCFDFWPTVDSRLGMSVQEMLGFTPLDVDRGFGRLQKIGATREMAEAFQAVHAYIGIVKASPASTPDLSLLTDQRNLTQHTLICLAPVSELDCFSNPTEAATYEACRLAALIFGVGVIFPIPQQNTPLNTLARSIRSVLLQPSSSELWSSPSTRLPLIWVLALGGIAATGIPERGWFVSAFGDITRKSGLTAWASVKSVLASMLWYDAACDRAAEALWLEAVDMY